VNINRFTFQINTDFGTIPVPNLTAKGLDERGDCPPFEPYWCGFLKYDGERFMLFGVHICMVLHRSTFVNGGTELYIWLPMNDFKQRTQSFV